MNQRFNLKSCKGIQIKKDEMLERKPRRKKTHKEYIKSIIEKCFSAYEIMIIEPIINSFIDYYTKNELLETLSESSGNSEEFMKSINIWLATLLENYKKHSIVGGKYEMYFATMLFEEYMEKQELTNNKIREELLDFYVFKILLFLAYERKRGVLETIEKGIELSKKIMDGEQKNFYLSTFYYLKGSFLDSEGYNASSYFKPVVDLIDEE